jgi:queuine tRNA-ribosyltransferase
MKLGDYEVVVRAPGCGAVRQISSGEVMHSVNDPSTEAYALYVKQAGILDELKPHPTPLVIWDVGLGAATNVMACVRRLEDLGSFEREVRIVSFERDLDPLRLAARYPYLFDHLKHRAPHTLLRKGSWQSSRVPLSWELLEGDFVDCMSKAPSPDIIWFDPFSYKVDTALWSVDAFSRVLAKTEGKSTRLYTYSASTAVRTSMLLAGWFVGRGLLTGPKDETTVAYNLQASEAGLAHDLLDRLWLERWGRSDSKGPIGSSIDDLASRVFGHPQFAAA